MRQPRRDGPANARNQPDRKSENQCEHDATIAYGCGNFVGGEMRGQYGPLAVSPSPSPRRSRQRSRAEPSLFNDDVAPKEPLSESLHREFQADPLQKMPFWVNAQQHEPWHRHMAAEHEFAEIFVLCEQKSVFVICSAQDVRVRHSRGDLRHVNGVMPGAA